LVDYFRNIEKDGFKENENKKGMALHNKEGYNENSVKIMVRAGFCTFLYQGISC
jgi:hypothetical protein